MSAPGGGIAPAFIALDTNVLLRTLVEDDRAQSTAARRLMEECDRTGTRVLLTHVVLCECVWVLGSWYRMKKPAVVDVLDALRSASLLEFEDRGAFEGALAAWRKGRGDFSDYLVGEVARGKGCDAVVTFDGKLIGEEGFRAPSPPY